VRAFSAALRDISQHGVPAPQLCSAVHICSCSAHTQMCNAACFM
jgi:hypothetical protein